MYTPLLSIIALNAKAKDKDVVHRVQVDLDCLKDVSESDLPCNAVARDDVVAIGDCAEALDHWEDILHTAD